MSSPDGQRRILAAIENELRADPTFAAAFRDFSGASRHRGEPEFPGRLIMCMLVTMTLVVVALTVLLAAWAAVHQRPCTPAHAASRAPAAATCVAPYSGKTADS